MVGNLCLRVIHKVKMSDSNLQKQDLPDSETLDIREQVWVVADSILESGRYPTRKDICQALKKSSHTVGTHFTQWRKANPRSAVAAQLSNSEITKSRNGHQVSHSGARRVASYSNLPKADEEVQYNTARDLAAERYYRKTWNFTVPGLRENLEEALQEIDELAREQDETLNPLGMVDWLIKRDYQQS